MRSVIDSVIALVVLGAMSLSCASYPPTPVKGALQFPKEPLVQGAALDVSVDYFYLRALDTVKGSKRSESKRDHRLAAEAVAAQVEEDVHVLSPGAAPTSRFVCMMKVHQYINWAEILYVVLPIPHSSNESICVTAELSINEKKRRTIGSYEECGFNKQSGFWFVEGWDQPSDQKLREVMISRVLAEVTDDFRREARREAVAR